MNHSLLLVYTFFAARYFVPMTTFMTPFLIEKKKFTNKEIFNSITPFFFLSSALAAILGPILIKYAGSKYTIILDTVLEVICYYIFYIMGERNFLLTGVSGVIHGVVTSFGSLTKSIILEHRPETMPVQTAWLYYTMIKKFCGVLSSWVGQELKYATGTHQTSLILSAITLISSLGICAFIPDKSNAISSKDSAEKATVSLFDGIINLYTSDVCYYACLNIIGSSLYIAFAFFSASIFIERKRDVDPSVFLLGRFLYTLSVPVRGISRIFVYLVSFFDNSISYQPSYDKNTIIFGYIDGLAKIVSILSAYLLSLIVKKNLYLASRCFCATLCVMIFTFLLGKTRSLMTSYVVYILGAVASQTAMLWSYTGLSKNVEAIPTIMGVNLLISNIIHISISYITKIKNYGVSKKLMLYFYVNIALLGVAGAILSLGNIK